MIREADRMRVEIHRQVQGGKGEVRIQHIFEKGELKGDSRLLGVITLEPGCSIGLHEHKDEEEIFYIISGYGRVVDAGHTWAVGPGDAVLTGDGEGHAIENCGAEPLKFLTIILTC
ncbi:MAG: cupin domain-containing protein [Firmicutes bacterium]|nr:cupin domain-containing protein [Bacillota bacterium]